MVKTIQRWWGQYRNDEGNTAPGSSTINKIYIVYLAWSDLKKLSGNLLQIFIKEILTYSGPRCVSFGTSHKSVEKPGMDSLCVL